MNFARWVFWVAGIYGLLVLVPQYFGESLLGRIDPPPVTHPEFYYGFVGVAVAWQVMFLIMADDPLRYRPAMWPAMFEKFSFAGATIVLYLQHRLSLMPLCGGLGDLVLGILFVIAYWKTSDPQLGQREHRD